MPWAGLSSGGASSTGASGPSYDITTSRTTGANDRGIVLGPVAYSSTEAEQFPEGFQYTAAFWSPGFTFDQVWAFQSNSPGTSSTLAITAYSAAADGWPGLRAFSDVAIAVGTTANSYGSATGLARIMPAGWIFLSVLVDAAGGTAIPVLGAVTPVHPIAMPRTNNFMIGHTANVTAATIADFTAYNLNQSPSNNIGYSAASATNYMFPRLVFQPAGW